MPVVKKSLTLRLQSKHFVRVFFCSLLSFSFYSQVKYSMNDKERSVKRNWNSREISIVCLSFFAYHFFLLGDVNVSAQLQVCSHFHGFLNGQVSVKLIVLHNVAWQFSESTQIPFVTVHRDATLHASGSVKQTFSNYI